MRTQAELDAIVAELRAAHWALRAPLRYNGIRQVLRDQEITVEAMPLPVRAMTVLQFGCAAISISSDLLPREQTPVLAEEYAHAKLHAGEPGELTIHLFPMKADDPREYEADYVARCMLAGPGVAVEYRTPADNRPRRPVRVTVPPAFDPYTSVPGILMHRSAPRYAAFAGESRAQQAMRLARRVPRPMRAGPHSEADVVRYEHEGIVRFVDADGRWWRLYDLAYRPQREVVALGDLSAKCRLFVSEAGAQRRYTFTRWELRDAAARHLYRQLRESVAVPIRQDRNSRSA